MRTLILSGCGTSGDYGQGGVVPELLISKEGQSSKSSDEYIIPEYSEISGDLDTTKYFDVLLTSENKYFIVEEDGKKYRW